MWKPGQSGNPNGRPAGSPNRATAGIRQRINDFILENWDAVVKDFNSSDAKERLQFFEKLLQFALPKLQSTSLVTDPGDLSDEALENLVNEILDRDGQVDEG